MTAARIELADGVFLISGGRFGYGHPVNCNIYVVVGKRDIALIDTGCGFGTGQVLASLERHGVRPSDVSIAIHTHSHWDHARGASLISQATGCSVAVHHAGASVLEQGPWMEVGSGAPLEVTFQACGVDRRLTDGDEVDLGGRKLRVVHTPGHTSDSVCLELTLDSRRILFSGDTVFAGGKPGIVSAESDLRAYRDSVKQLARSSCDALLPGHGAFILSNAIEHVDMLAKRLSGKWADIGVAVYPPPFESGVWFYKAHPELLRGD
jgi:glyoxylase-like metal-dependent hydrolase (beta-lactamase superfamily II)